MRWFTRAELMEKHKLESVVDAIVKGKKSEGAWRPHPDAPAFRTARAPCQPWAVAYLQLWPIPVSLLGQP